MITVASGTVIQGYVTIMREDIRDPFKLQEYIQVINETVRRAQR
jgi:hypothetical protein